MPYKTILFEIKENIAWLKINRPEVKNALCMNFFIDFEKAIEETKHNQLIRMLVITGTGDSFASGADLNEVLQMNKKEAFQNARFVQKCFQSLKNLKIPVLAAINGYCYGGGLELALSCDIRICHSSARFALPESKIGICPGGGGTQLFTQVAGKSNAMHYLLSGKSFDAQRALSMGIISEIVTEDDFEQYIDQFVNQLVLNSIEAIVKIKELILIQSESPSEESFIQEAKYFSELINTSGQEGIQAFLEKRKPKWN